MASVLIASDASWVHEEIRSALPADDITVISVVNGRSVRAVVAEEVPDLVVLDSQIGSMGAMAVCSDLRLEESGGRIKRVRVLILLDRQADVFLAKQVKADGWLVKPIDPLRARRAMRTILEDGYYVDRPQLGDAGLNYQPTPDATAR